MKYLTILLITIASFACAATTPTQNVTQAISTKEVNDNIVVPSGKSVTINAGASIINNGTATGFNLDPTGVAAGNYGNGATTITLGVNEYGQLTAVNAVASTPTESNVTFTDITTNNASTTKHGYLPKCSANVLTFLGAADYAAMRSQLSLVPGTNVQAWSANLDTLAAGFGGPPFGGGFVFWDKATLAYTRYSTIPNASLAGSGSFTVNSLTISLGDLVSASSFKTALALNNVANADTTNASNISSGSLALARIAQGGATSGQALAWNGTTWAPSTLSSGLTINTTTTSGASSGDILTSDGTKVQKLTPGSGVSTWLATPTLANLQSATSGLAVTGSANQFASAQRIGNASGDYFALGSGSARDLRVSSNAFGLGSAAFLVGMYDSGVMQATSSSTVFWEADVAIRGDAVYYGLLRWNDGSSLFKRAANSILLKDAFTGSNAAAFAVANTYTDSTHWESAVIDWQTTANTLRIGSAVGASGGTARDVQLIRGGTVRATINANTINFSNIPTSATGLSSGDIYQAAGVLMIVP